jgi:hypothetical protein
MAKLSKNSPVSLDALIPREAFEIKDQQEAIGEQVSSLWVFAI